MMTKKPLAEELRPKKLSQFFGQESLLHQQGLIASTLTKKRPLSLLLWGPPGCGKTSLAHIYAEAFDAEVLYFHPAYQGIPELKKWIQSSETTPLFSRQNLVFIDEIHRLNKSQQDALLPFVEKGTFILIGATTENPSFHLNSALLSRLRVLKMDPLSEKALESVLENALSYTGLLLEPTAKKHLIEESQGDARHLINQVESLLSSCSSTPLSLEKISESLSRRLPLYDAHGDMHYALTSALHKSIRGSDPDAALYWLARMFLAGEDPHFIARRLLRISIEDIGLADPSAQSKALDAWQTYERLGSPEGELALAELTLFLALSPKSNSSYSAYQKAQELAKKTAHLPPPDILLPATSSTAKALGYGAGYQYDPDLPEGFSGQNYFPPSLSRPSFYQAKERGYEREMKKRQDYFDSLRAKKRDFLGEK